MTDLVPAASEQEALGVKLFLAGDFSDLSEREQAQVMLKLCETYGLNPLTRPFMILKQNVRQPDGRWTVRKTLYATKAVTDQLRMSHGLSDTITDLRIEDGLIWARARIEGQGRVTEDVGIVPYPDWERATAEDRANAIMKAVTKAKRRATLAHVGLSMLDETEIETIPNASVIEPPQIAIETSKAAPPADEDEVEGEEEEEADPLEDDLESVVFESQEELVEFLRDALQTGMIPAARKSALVQRLKGLGASGSTMSQLIASAWDSHPEIREGRWWLEG